MSDTTTKQMSQELNAAGLQIQAQPLTSESLMRNILTQQGLKNLNLAPRAKIVGDFAQEGAIGYLFAPRGEGKTWMGLYLAKCIASGQAFGPYKVGRPWPVLYIDGEMNIRSLQDRMESLPAESEELRLCSADLLWRQLPQSFKGLDFNSTELQTKFLKVIDMLKPKVVFIDNLSCTFFGMNENEASDWEQAMPFLAQLKHRGILIIILHHTTKKGDEMRGTSKREDQADFIIRLTKLDDGKAEKGTLRLKTEFTKNRNCELDEENDELGWTFDFNNGIPANVSFRVFSKRQQVLLAIKRGMTNCPEIAEELRISRSHVYSLVKRLEADGLVWNKDGVYTAVDPNLA